MHVTVDVVYHYGMNSTKIKLLVFIPIQIFIVATSLFLYPVTDMSINYLWEQKGVTLEFCWMNVLRNGQLEDIESVGV